MQNKEVPKAGLAGKKILVTGGAGFIGSNLVAKLLGMDVRVICIDNFITGKRENIAGYINHPHFTFVEGDIRDFKTCITCTENVDYVLHQAALGSVPRSIENPLVTNEINITGFLNMITAARDSGVKRFVYAASSSSYGDHPGLPKVEEHIGNPLSPYAVTKYVNELYAQVYSRVYGLEVVGLRYFNVFGPNQDPDGPYAAVIPRFIKSMLSHESPVINGDGSHSRDFTYIDNVVDANILAITTDNKEALNTVYNIAFGGRTTLNALVEILKTALVKHDSEIVKIMPVYGSPRKGDVLHSYASVDKAKRLLGYSPSCNIQQGIDKSIDWYIRYFSK